MPRVVLLAAPCADSWGHPLVRRLLGLLDRGWDAQLVLDGSSQAEPRGLEGVGDDVLRDRVHPPPLRVRGGLRRGLLAGLARSAAARPMRLPLEVARERPLPRRYARAVVAALRPDILHVMPPVEAGAWAGLARAVDSRIVTGLRWDETDSIVSGAGNGRPGWEVADALHLDSEALARFSREQRRERRPLGVVPPTPGPELAATAPPAAPPEAPLRILSIGPLSWTRGYEHALSATRRLIDGGTACTFRIVGTGEYADAVAFARHQLGLHNVVDIQDSDGYDDLREHLQWSDVVLNAAVVPTSPKPLFDACVLGRPVVTTEPLEGADAAAAVVPRRDPDAMAEELSSLANPETRRRIGEAGRAQVAALDRLDHLDELEDLYRRALAKA